MGKLVATCCYLYFCLNLAKQLASILEDGFASQSLRMLCFRLKMDCIDTKRVRHIAIRRQIVADVNMLIRHYSIEIFDVVKKLARAFVDTDVAGGAAPRI
ncbi:hypothetical protein A8F33_06600 [Burkholderia cenocepacia]|nr:hypothetical protein A8F32_24255 [Burkholderia cenocepacia]ONJ10016.1 hypothetical protein A8F33_06600 [Burkholderia cenocepacia]